MDHDRLKELLPLEALGALDGEDARAMAAHLADGCDECQAELRSLRETLAAYAIGVTGDGSADRIWQRVERRLATAAAPIATAVSDRPASRASDRPIREGVTRVWRVAAVAASAAAILLALMSGNYAKQLEAMRQDDAARFIALDRQTRELASQLEDRNRELATLRDQVSVNGKLTEAVLAPDARIIRLGPLAPAPDAAGLVAIAPTNNRAVLHVAGLPQAPPGKEYELWWIGSKSGPIKAALFEPAAHGDATVASTLPPAGEQLLASAVTLEPAGGVDKPTGAMYLKGAP